MKKYSVTVQAVITKDVIVEASNEDEAYELAHESFSVFNDDSPENYEENTLNMTELK